jgi:hypothetical protein
MGYLWGAIREIAYAVGILVVGILVGQIAHRVVADFFPAPHMDRSSEASLGAGVVVGVIAVAAHITLRIVRRRKRQRLEKA